MLERRRLTRWVKLIDCTFTFEGRTYRGIVSNLSYIGARVQDVGFLPPAGSRLVLSLMHEGIPVSVTGRVVYAKGISIGLSFEESRGICMKRLRPFLLEDLKS